MKSLILSLIILLGLFISSTILLAQSSTDGMTWTQFRGNNGSGIADETANPPVEFGENKNLLWKIDLPVGSSSPVVWENKLYLTGFAEDKNMLQTICLNRTNGEILWRDSISPEEFEKPHAISNPAQATIAADADGIYVYFASSGLRCFSHDGQVKWNYPIPVPEKVLYGSPGSPVIMDDKVIIKLDYGNKEQRSLLALDKHTGNVIWKSLIQENTPFVNYEYPGYSTPVRFQNQVILHRCGGVASYSLGDGSPVWWFQLMTNGIGTPIIYNDVIYINAWMELSEKERRGEYFSYGNFENVLKDFDQNGDSLIELNELPKDMMIFTRPDITDIENTQWAVGSLFKGMDKDKNGFINNTEWIQAHEYWSSFVQDFGLLAIHAGLKGELTFDDILWMQLEKTPEVPSPLAYGDCIYMVKDGGWVTCMDAKTGKVHFQEKLGAPGACIASPVMANGKIYLASYNGIIKVIEASEKPVVISETKLEGKILATPAIVENNLYIRTSEHLYAFQQ